MKYKLFVSILFIVFVACTYFTAWYGFNAKTDNGEAFSFDNDYKKRAIIETMMHEFGHALEELFDTEFNEDLIDKAIESYNETYKSRKF